MGICTHWNGRKPATCFDKIISLKALTSAVRPQKLPSNEQRSVIGSGHNQQVRLSTNLTKKSRPLLSALGNNFITSFFPVPVSTLNSFGANLKEKLKYYFSRLIVLFIALQTLDASVDIDYLTAQMNWHNSEDYDDIDTISEFFIERALNNDDYIPEGKTDDHHHSQKHVHAFPSLTFFYTNNAETSDVNPEPAINATTYPSLRNTAFRTQDFSLLNYTPPDQAAI